MRSPGNTILKLVKYKPSFNIRLLINDAHQKYLGHLGSIHHTMSPTPVIHPPKAFHLRNQETAVPCAQIVHMKSCYLWPAVFGGTPQRREGERKKKRQNLLYFNRCDMTRTHAKGKRLIGKSEEEGADVFFLSGSEDTNTLRST